MTISYPSNNSGLVRSMVFHTVRFVWRLMPTKLKLAVTEHPRLILRRNFLYDCSRYSKWAIDYQQTPSKEHLQAVITQRYHIVEKGLSLKNPRLGFGVDNANNLLACLDSYVSTYAPDEVVVVALKSLDAYLKFHELNKVVVDSIAPRVAKLWEISSSHTIENLNGGVQQKRRSEIHADGKQLLDSFFHSRHSIRHFGDNPASREEIEHAIQLAITTPSVCNRQAWRVHIYTGKQAESILRHQNGNRGFGDQASHIVIVTTDLRCFLNKSERNQAWIDGGMFAMSLVYALHSLGLGTCCLNMSNDMQSDCAVRDTAEIPEYEVCIMMIAAGTLPDSLNVARSQRLGLDKISQWH